MRLQKFIAKSGISSRRKAEELIKKGRVKVNNNTIKAMGIRVNPDEDTIKLDNKIITLQNKKIYIILNKPVGYVTTLKDEFNRKTVIDLINIEERVYPIGRLDKNTEGLILLTNDGELTNKITHPSFEIEKTYIATIKGVPSNDKINLLKEGIFLNDKKTYPAKVALIDNTQNLSTIKITIHEGRNRQVRRMMASIGHPVISLKRTQIANLKLENLELGKWRKLTEKEVNYLKEL